MPELKIDRLTLKLSGISELEGQRLAKLITEGLANSNISSQAADIPNLKVNIPSRPNASVDWLAEQIVADILRQLN
ncbi:hypothetical protein [Nostoc sp. WHI]|uniref:hypothetical protein n=1 Tax=Nostoc sp. WHI TaxID=2650611 RepID=UPI0018C4C438|nr:hypothetical protein [Nostoc sp. WHI]MBG1270882.1 hypothetical protein [Nostoc sp. WHI]